MLASQKTRSGTLRHKKIKNTWFSERGAGKGICCLAISAPALIAAAWLWGDFFPEKN